MEAGKENKRDSSEGDVRQVQEALERLAPIENERATVIMWDHTERERIIEQALGAYTQSDITRASQELQQWVRDNPNDVGIVDAFEVLSHKQDFAEERERRKAEPLSSTA